MMLAEREIYNFLNVIEKLLGYCEILF